MPEDWQASPLKRLQIAAIAGLGYPLINALGHTLRWRVEGMHHLDAITASGRQPVMAFWHGRILPATFYFRGRGIVVITSENFDGEWIARIIERFGYGTARGSSTRGGRKAMVQLVRAMKAGKTCGIHARRPARSRARGAAGRRLACRRDRQSDFAVSPRGGERLDAPQLGSDANPQAADQRRSRDRRADRGAPRRLWTMFVNRCG
jgi:hypothetical protein